MTVEERPRILVIGDSGQVGWELVRTLAPLGEIRAVGRQIIDLANLDSIRPVIRATKPTVIVNAAAYTNVDGAESEEPLAQRINGEAPGILAEEARRLDATLVHYSTDYVFDGASSRGYIESDVTAPLNAYGRSKLAGELSALASAGDTYVFRVSWVYGSRGRNFLRTIQRLATSLPELRVVNDQIGSPTWSRSIAECTAQALSQILRARRQRQELPPSGVYHMTAPDHASWYDFAKLILTATADDRDRAPDVHAITTAEFPTAATRPLSSVMHSGKLLATFGLRLPSWRDQFRLCVDRGV